MKHCGAFLLKLFISGTFIAMTAWAQTESGWRIYTIAGTGQPSHGGDGGRAVEAQLDLPVGVAVDNTGNVFISELYSQRIRRVDVTGTITTFAGTGEPSYGGDGGPAVRARLSFPLGVAVDHIGNVYIADTGNDRIRQVDATGTITTFAGTGEEGYDWEGPAVEAKVARPRGVAVDSSGNLYFTGPFNFGIRHVDDAGNISQVPGSGEPYDGPEDEQRVSRDRGVAVDGSGNLYIANIHNNYVRRVDATGTVSVVAGTREPGYGGDGGPAAEAQLNYPTGVAVDKAGNLYIADTGNHRIRRVDTFGTITTIAGTGVPGYSGDGGPAAEAQLASPYAVAVDGSGNLFVADLGNYRIRVLTRAASLSPPTELTVTVVSYNGIDLAWQDNSDNESGFSVQRRVDGSTDWVEIGTTAANTTMFSDVGLQPTTTYHYRVQAFNIIRVFRLLEPGPGEDPGGAGADPDPVQPDTRAGGCSGKPFRNSSFRSHRRKVQRSRCLPIRGRVGNEHRGRGSPGRVQRPDQRGDSGGNSGERRSLHGDDRIPQPPVRAHRSAGDGTDSGFLLHFRADSHQPGQ